MPESTESNTPICHDDEISPTPPTEGFLLRHYVSNQILQRVAPPGETCQGTINNSIAESKKRKEGETKPQDMNMDLNPQPPEVQASASSNQRHPMSSGIFQTINLNCFNTGSVVNSSVS